MSYNSVVTKVVKGNAFYHLSIPFVRNQDFTKTQELKNGVSFVALCDGWNHREKVPGDNEGKKASRFVAKYFQKLFLASKEKDLIKRTKTVCKLLDEKFLSAFPHYVSSVAAFLVVFPKDALIVRVGDVDCFLWKKNCWQRPKVFKDYSLDEAKFGSDVSRFFGRGELKGSSIFSADPDILITDSFQPILLASDGLLRAMSEDELNSISKEALFPTEPNTFIEYIRDFLKKAKTQNDDITVLLKK